MVKPAEGAQPLKDRADQQVPLLGVHSWGQPVLSSSCCQVWTWPSHLGCRKKAGFHVGVMPMGTEQEENKGDSCWEFGTNQDLEESTPLST